MFVVLIRPKQQEPDICQAMPVLLHSSQMTPQWTGTQLILWIWHSIFLGNSCPVQNTPIGTSVIFCVTHCGNQCQSCLLSQHDMTPASLLFCPSAGDYILETKPKEISEAQRLNYEQVKTATYYYLTGVCVCLCVRVNKLLTVHGTRGAQGSWDELALLPLYLCCRVDYSISVQV